MRNDWLGFQIKTRGSQREMSLCGVKWEPTGKKGVRSIGSSFLNVNYFNSICNWLCLAFRYIILVHIRVYMEITWYEGCVSPLLPLPFLLPTPPACLSICRAMKMTHYLLPFEDLEWFLLQADDWKEILHWKSIWKQVHRRPSLT